ncbi:ABC transporter substrate-binding protein [Streptosporangium sp. NPDC002544]|uniref:ABC transporter substrate-binding protein n=1 Tax=Streptosporangium sp. NPDC002544 TaxID=3154538 RepID=UPI00331EE2A4
MNRQRRNGSVIAGLLAVALSLAACGGGGDTATGGGEAAPDSGGVLVRAMDLAVNGGLGFDPATMATGEYTNTYPVTNSFLKMDATGEFQPDLAQEVKIVDSSTIRVVLRPNLKFSDGEVLDAQAAVNSIKRTQEGKPAGLRMADGLALIASMDVESPTEFTINLSAPKSGLFYKLLADAETTPVSPKTISVPGDHERDVVTAGPFKIESYQPGIKVVLAKNELYWDAANVKLSKIEYQHTANRAAAVNALRAGTVDFVTGTALISHSDREGLPPNLKSESRTLQAPWVQTMCISDANPLGKLKVRQALNYATNRDEVNKLLYAGDSEPAWGLVPKNSPVYSEELVDLYPYDVEKAKQLLAEAGYPDGFSINAITTAGDGQRHQEIVQSQWLKVGVKINIIPTSNQVEDWFVNKGEKGQISGYTPIRPMPDIFPRVFTTDAFANVCHFPVPTLDECSTQATALDPTTEEFKTRVKECQAIVVKDLALGVPTVFPLQDMVYNDKVIGNMTYQTDPLTQWQPDVTKIFIKKS